MNEYVFEIRPDNAFHAGWMACCLGGQRYECPEKLQGLKRETWETGFDTAFETGFAFREVAIAMRNLGQLEVKARKKGAE